MDGKLWRVMVERSASSPAEILMDQLIHKDACRLMHGLRGFDVRCYIEWDE